MLAKTKQLLKSNNYTLFQRPYELNIVAYRSRFIRSNRFDDEIHVFYKNGTGKWVYHIFSATTDPGQYWLDNPLDPQGTAFLKKGQYTDAYAMGLHKGRYTALVQVKPVSVIRDYNRRGLFNWVNTGTADKGLFGINVHRAFDKGTAKVIDHFSAGCLVFANSDDYGLFLKLLSKHRGLYGNSFTLTLMDFRDKRRRIYSRIAWGSLMASSMLAIGRISKKAAYETIPQ